MDRCGRFLRCTCCFWIHLFAWHGAGPYHTLGAPDCCDPSAPLPWTLAEALRRRPSSSATTSPGVGNWIWTQKITLKSLRCHPSSCNMSLLAFRACPWWSNSPRPALLISPVTPTFSQAARAALTAALGRSCGWPSFRPVHVTSCTSGLLAQQLQGFPPTSRALASTQAACQGETALGSLQRCVKANVTWLVQMKMPSQPRLRTTKESWHIVTGKD